jgi:hypothetical protein
MRYLRNRKGIAPIMIGAIVIGVLVAFYLVLFIPLPAFKALRQTINFYLILSIWVGLQILIIWGFTKLVIGVRKSIKTYKQNILRWNLRIKEWIMLH